MWATRQPFFVKKDENKTLEFETHSENWSQNDYIKMWSKVTILCKWMTKQGLRRIGSVKKDCWKLKRMGCCGLPYLLTSSRDINK